jgi:cytochrome bd ubiquinol oxidase subunit I
MDVEMLSRVQFAFTIMFHYIFPPFSIGMGLLLVIYEASYLITKNKIYENITRFWIKIFAANFAVGVASGIVMEFEFGTNWASYSRFVGDVFGSPLAAEGIFAFFLESGFLAILLFGWGRVKPWVHMVSTVLVSIGSIMSAFWIVVANSWQQTPVAYELVTTNGFTRAEIVDFWGMVFNPSAMVRFTHSVNGAFIQGSFLVISVAAYFLIKKRHIEFAKRSIATALIVATIASVAQLFIGHWHAKVVAEHQPPKLAAFEGQYETTDNASLTIFGYTNEDKRETVAFQIPGMLSWLIYGDVNGVVTGLNDFPEDEWPPVAIVFQTYHIMVGLGMFFIAFTLFSSFLLIRKKLFQAKWILQIMVISVILPVIANQLGWVSAEVGRQPWVVYGLMKTSEGISKSVTAPEVWTSLILFFIVYTLLFFVWLYVLDREIKHGPEKPDENDMVYKVKGERVSSFKKMEGE